VPTNGEKIAAYDLFDNDQLPVSLMIAGPGDATHVTNLIDIAEKRKDLVVFASPERADVVGVSNSFTQTNNVRNFFLNIASTSYAVFDSGYKKMYDKYNDQYRYIPLNGDTAGCTANAELVAEAWYSPAGLNRGNIRSAVGLAYNPSQTQRDNLYRNRVNPICSFPGEGTLLWGDKTALARNSAFNRINVRRLFNFIEDAIERAAKAVLFEFNDEFTREQFVGMVEPFLRDVQGRRGITDFQVVCDETNNTGQVIDANELRADIYIKPARSINFITLTFVATRTGVDFADVIG
jgi:phage tail sheath protein FI